MMWLRFDRASGGAGGVPVLDPQKNRFGLSWRRIYGPFGRWTPFVRLRIVRCHVEA